jgi:hypothetical protein
MRIKSLFTTLFIVALFVCLPAITNAQFEDPDPVPFDGGLSLVIAAGVGYAIKKKYDQRKKERIKQEKERIK